MENYDMKLHNLCLLQQLKIGQQISAFRHERLFVESHGPLQHDLLNFDIVPEVALLDACPESIEEEWSQRLKSGL